MAYCSFRNTIQGFDSKTSKCVAKRTISHSGATMNDQPENYQLARNLSMSCISLFLIGLLSCGCCIFFCQNIDNIEVIQDAAEAGGVFGSATSMCVKVFVSIWKRKEIISFSDNIGEQYSRDLKKHPDITNAFARQFSLITKVLFVVLGSLPTLYTIASLVGNDEPKHPIIMVIPFLPSEGWPFFHIVYLIQIAIMLVGCTLELAVEFLPFFFIQFVCCQIEILAQKIEQWNVNLKHNHRKDEARKNTLLLEEIVQYHSSIKRNMAVVKRIFSPMLMVTLLTYSMVLCMCLFIISENPLPKICSHLCFALLLTFLYCYGGNRFINQNSNLVEKVKLIDFYYLDVPQRKSYMNVVQNSYHPIKLKSYFVTFDMALFFKVVKFAYSVFSLMKARI